MERKGNFRKEAGRAGKGEGEESAGLQADDGGAEGSEFGAGRGEAVLYLADDGSLGAVAGGILAAELAEAVKSLLDCPVWTTGNPG